MSKKNKKTRNKHNKCSKKKNEPAYCWQCKGRFRHQATVIKHAREVGHQWQEPIYWQRVPRHKVAPSARARAPAPAPAPTPAPALSPAQLQLTAPFISYESLMRYGGLLRPSTMKTHDAFKAGASSPKSATTLSRTNVRNLNSYDNDELMPTEQLDVLGVEDWVPTFSSAQSSAHTSNVADGYVQHSTSAASLDLEDRAGGFGDVRARRSVPPSLTDVEVIVPSDLARRSSISSVSTHTGSETTEEDEHGDNFDDCASVVSYASVVDPAEADIADPALTSMELLEASSDSHTSSYYDAESICAPASPRPQISICSVEGHSAEATLQLVEGTPVPPTMPSLRDLTSAMSSLSLVEPGSRSVGGHSDEAGLSECKQGAPCTHAGWRSRSAARATEDAAATGGSEHAVSVSYRCRSC